MGCSRSSAVKDYHEPVEQPAQHISTYFPMNPRVSYGKLNTCKISWKKNVEEGYGVHFFCKEFSRRLNASNKYRVIVEAFDELYLEKKDEVLLDMIYIITNLDENSYTSQVLFKRLGVYLMDFLHDPRLFSGFFDTLISTIFFCLEEDATSDIKDAWLNVVGCLLQFTYSYTSTTKTHFFVEESFYYCSSIDSTTAACLMDENHTQKNDLIDEIIFFD